jgi:hypothetical protein
LVEHAVFYLANLVLRQRSAGTLLLALELALDALVPVGVEDIPPVDGRDRSSRRQRGASAATRAVTPGDAGEGGMNSKKSYLCTSPKIK